MTRSTALRIAEWCERGGLDLTHELSLAWLDAATRESLPDPLRPDAAAHVIGNTRALWPFVRRARGRDHPVEAWCEEVVDALASDIGAEVFYAHRRYHGRYLPFQRIAHQAGMLHLAPSHLALHPTHGPWVALRALLVLDAPGPTRPVRPAPDPCAACDKPCLTAMDAALTAPDDDHGWRRWLAVRDACPVGRASRYGEAQIAYHYTKDPRWLEVDEEPR